MDLFVLVVAAGWVIVPERSLDSRLSSDRPIPGTESSPSSRSASRSLSSPRQLSRSHPASGPRAIHLLRRTSAHRIVRLGRSSRCRASSLVAASHTGSASRRFCFRPANPCVLRTAASHQRCSAWISSREAARRTPRLGGCAHDHRRRRWPVPVSAAHLDPLAVIISTATCIAGTRALLDFIPFRGSDAAAHSLKLFQLGAPPRAALVTWTGTDQFALMKTLFWTPTVDRVLVLGGGSASDGYASTPTSFQSPGGFVDRDRRPMRRAIRVRPRHDGCAARARASRGPTKDSWLRRSPLAVFLGLDRDDRYLEHSL